MSNIWEEGRGRARRLAGSQLRPRLEVHLRQEVSNDKGQETKRKWGGSGECGAEKGTKEISQAVTEDTK